jgi:acyl-CoA synthetase (NDP forming)
VCSDLPENIDRESREILIDGGVTPLQGVDAGLDAIANACRYGLIRERLLSAAGQLQFSMIETPANESNTRVVDEWQGKQRLIAAGVDVPQGQLIDIGASDEPLEGLRYPVVLKAVSADLPHKTEAGAVRVNLQNARQLRSAIEAMRKSIARVAPDLKIEQLLVESMIEGVVAELMVGINTDPQFGQLLVIASGGVLVELTRDAKTLLLPTDAAQIRAALEALKCFKLLQGFRGRAGVDIEMVVERIHALTRFAEAHQSTLLEMDVNPLMVTPGRCVAADIMIREILR